MFLFKINYVLGFRHETISTKAKVITCFRINIRSQRVDLFNRTKDAIIIKIIRPTLAKPQDLDSYTAWIQPINCAYRASKWMRREVEAKANHCWFTRRLWFSVTPHLQGNHRWFLMKHLYYLREWGLQFIHSADFPHQFHQCHWWYHVSYILLSSMKI